MKNQNFKLLKFFNIQHYSAHFQLEFVHCGDVFLNFAIDSKLRY